MKVLVTHPGRQHSHQAAVALARARFLSGYWSGVPSTAEQFARVPRALRGTVKNYSPIAIPPELGRWAPGIPARRRIGDRLLPRALAGWNDFAACRAFDRWVANRLDQADAGAVLACEISAATTFARAQSRGLRTLLDAPSFHHATQDRLTGVQESLRLHARIARVKDAEIALADHILTVSPLARESYLAAGVPEDRVHSLELGADLELFRPPTVPPSGKEAVFLFCGAMLHRKGFDVLIAAFRALGEAPVRLRIAGPPGDASDALREGTNARIEILGALPQERLAQSMREADCLVLPSRHDSYGMVVAEALACGLPAIVSETVGAKSLVRPGETGWIVPTADLAALTTRLQWCAEHLDTLRGMRDACRRVAEGATWKAYHARFVGLLERLLAEP